MSLKSVFKFTASALLSLMAVSSQAAPIKIEWWHAMNGPLGEKVEKLAKDFNASQTAYEIDPVFKGTYPETMTGAIAAFRAHKQPAIVQVFEVGTATMMAAKGAVYPVYQLMKDEGQPFDEKSFIPAVTSYYSDTSGNLLSFPFNSSTPVLYINKTEFTKAGLDPTKLPATWPEVEADAKKLRAAGVACGLTTAWPSWVLVENFHALHNLPLGTMENGFAGLGTRLEINDPLEVKLWTELTAMQKDKEFDYGGRADSAQAKFDSGNCGMMMESSASRAAIIAAKIDYAMGPMPYMPEVKGAPLNSIIGGATLWVLKGVPKEQYKGVAEFFSYLSKPEIQAWWHQNTGYLPITTAAYDLSKSQGFYDKNPGADVAIKQMTRGTPTPNSRGLRFGSFLQIRDIIEGQLEEVLTGKKTPKQGLDDAVTQGNVLLAQFEAANK